MASLFCLISREVEVLLLGWFWQTRFDKWTITGPDGASCTKPWLLVIMLHECALGWDHDKYLECEMVSVWNRAGVGLPQEGLPQEGLHRRVFHGRLSYRRLSHRK